MFEELKRFAYFGQETLITLNIKEEIIQIKIEIEKIEEYLAGGYPFG